MTAPAPPVRHLPFLYISLILKHLILQSGDDRVEQARKVQQVSELFLVISILC